MKQAIYGLIHKENVGIDPLHALAQVKGNFAVIPEHSAKDQRGKDRAEVFIGASGHGAHKKEVPVAFVAVFIEQSGEQHPAQAVDRGEGGVQKTAV